MGERNGSSIYYDYLNELTIIMTEKKEYLIELDSKVGDGDLGLTMSEGFKAAYEAIRSSKEKDLGKLLFIAGKAMSSAVPSTMGTSDGLRLYAGRKSI
ncbi:dihydroxyacetone kinase family protein [Enterococcus avium]|uniref:dihydroxyacetone kinase family protein n=1 Tax=Enterococcus avium TaxID=33945 RepID=UPI0022392A0C|nr:DAK2 domain-containing protein [Enterococcus avium]